MISDGLGAFYGAFWLRLVKRNRSDRRQNHFDREGETPEKLKIPDSSTIGAFRWFVKDSGAMGSGILKARSLL